MKERRKATRSNRILTILLIVFLIADFFLYKNRESGNAFMVFIFWSIFTILLGCGIVYNLIKNFKFKKIIKSKKKGVFQPINTKVIRFDFEAGLGSGKGYYHIISSNGQTEFSSESIKGTIVGFDTMELLPLYNIGFKYNILEIEKTIQELDKIKTEVDIKNYIENHNSVLNVLGKGIQQMSEGLFYDTMLSKINECKEYLKEISKTTEFKNSYLESKNYQIHIGDNITVYVDPNDPTIYQVDTDFLYN